ncbi:site-specific DNA-methyltransferase [Spongiibacter marinus]|uniref:site-specific DNA-methyltransferase n=1 Tax=Spongiibacter marinus TaxID=354246 RepID=UPI003562BF55
MSNSTQLEKAEQRRQKFAELLREMFQLNQPELDFGLYRIMHARKDDINRFIEEDLPSITRKAFEQFANLDKAQLQIELEETIEGLRKAKVDPETNEVVQDLRAQLKDNFDLAREEGEVYDALVTFFNRYYSDGDFLSRRVYKDGTYAIPYQGEEVVLHWANKDQYYIKSSETLRDYAFRLNPDAEEGEDPLRVHFKLVDAEVGAKDNNKESESSKRVFVLDTEAPFELIDSEPNAEGEVFQELQLRFFFRAATMDDWSEEARDKATAAAQKKPPTQDHLRTIAVEQLLGTTSELSEPWKSALARPYIKADGESADYSTLQGQLNNYTKKNTFDYFIHKDLSGFLTRELDFYIKNELMDWTDIAALKNDPTRLAPLLSKIEVIRTLGEKIITFLAQLENFQKKLWLKKKFVTETQYCITLDRIEEHEELLDTVFSNDKQKADWADLYKLDLAELEADLKKCGGDYTQLLAEPKYRYLMLDTAHFDEKFKADLLARTEDIDEQCDGLLVHSENFQALNLLQERYREQVDCVYIDPPYNTGNDGFAYKDQYQHSSWASALRDRLAASSALLSTEKGSCFVSIDDGEQGLLRHVLGQVFGEENFVSNIIWQKKYAPANDATWLSDDHDFLVLYAKRKDAWRPGKLSRDAKQNSAYKNLDGDSRGNWKAGDYKCNKTADERPNLYYPIVNPVTGQEVWPSRNRVWAYSPEAHAKNVAEDRLWWGLDGKNEVPAYKRFLSEVGGVVPRTIWKHEEVGHNQDGIRQLRDLIPDTAFTSPKVLGLIKRVQTVAKANLLLDFYAGSGTSGHSVVDMNREDQARRKYLLVEMGVYFDDVLLPRLRRSVYAKEWKSGIPVADDSGISHCLKYVRLESYEDALGNLSIKRSEKQLPLVSGGKEARQSYLMNYMLDVETRGSQSLLNTDHFLEPTQYQLNVRSASGDEAKTINVDLLETFNYLLGLRVEHIAAPLRFEAELKQGEHGRWTAAVKRNESGRWWFRTVYGTNPNGEKVVVVWRNLPSVIAGSEKGLEHDNAVLDAVLLEKLKIRLTESQDDEVDILYVNGDHNISIPRDRKGQPLEQARVQLIEEAFHSLMFADTETAH